MKKVLLAIDGVKPTQTVFNYAVQLCQRLKAELNVLQVIRPGRYGEYMKKVRLSAQRTKEFIEGSMVAATFAEAGEHEAAGAVMAEARKNLNELLPESEKAGVPFHLSVTSGRPGKEILYYLRKLRDVVLAIYDAPRQDDQGRCVETRRNTVPREIKRNLSVPLVVVRS